MKPGTLRQILKNAKLK
ncbi:hypothetical protein [Shimwellia blattae]